jgi:hypothetical protein
LIAAPLRALGILQGDQGSAVAGGQSHESQQKVTNPRQ